MDIQDSLDLYKTFTAPVNQSGEMVKAFTSLFIKQNGEILLGYKTRGFGVNLWNAFGGKVMDNEDVTIAAKRELYEESNLTVTDLKQLGVVSYMVGDNPVKSVVNIFSASRFKGELKPSEEMNPIKWFKFQDIPFDTMWPDSKIWYPYMLNDKFFNCFVKYDEQGNIIEQTIAECSQLEDVFKN